MFTVLVRAAFFAGLLGSLKKKIVTIREQKFFEPCMVVQKM